MPVSLGFDPEYFIAKNSTVIPVCGLLGGTKDSPIPFKNALEGYNYHEDNVLAEIGVPPAYNPGDAYHNLTHGIELLDGVLSGIDAVRVNKGQHRFTNQQLDPHAQAREFGCDPDFDAYTGGRDPRLNVPDFGNYRFPGGHIHLGGDFNCPAFVVALMCDLCLMTKYGRVSGATQRLKWYGQPGVFRVKEYGIEYRSLDSRWTVDEMSRYNVINSAWDLSVWLEHTPARDIKAVMEAISWLELREALRKPTIPNGAINAAVIRARAMGVPV